MNDQTTLSRAERQRIQLQAEIIEAAFLEFSERGYHQTAISDIAKRLGIGHGTFYRHFENKRDILDKVMSIPCSK
jgi:AcrR family transcriptional regulator